MQQLHMLSAEQQAAQAAALVAALEKFQTAPQSRAGMGMTRDAWQRQLLQAELDIANELQFTARKAAKQAFPLAFFFAFSRSKVYNKIHRYL